MFLRVCLFTLALVVGGFAGSWLSGGWGAAVGVALGAVAWFIDDLVRGLRVTAWLRRSEMGAQPPHLYGLWGDVVDRIRRALRARDQRTEQAQARLHETLAGIQASPNGVTLLDARGHIEWCNQVAALHFGFDPLRDQGQLVTHLVRQPAFTTYMATGDFSRDVLIHGRGHGPTRPVRVSAQLHPYGDGRRLLLSRDVTAIEQADTMRRDFVANVSHEIRTPLTVLLGFVETLQSLPLDEADRKRYLALMAQQASRMQALVSDLLTLSRLEGSPPPGGHEWVSLPALQASSEQEAQGLVQALERPQALAFEPAPALEVSGVPSEIASAVSNLVGNAIRYTPPGGAIQVAWRELADQRVEFSVRDTGPGIATEHLPRLTERFYRVDRSRSRDTGGTGLGLAIVKHVVQRHGGELRIDSRVGVGSTFSFTLPAGRVRAVVTPARADEVEPLAPAGR